MIFKPGNKPDAKYPGLRVGSSILFRPCGINDEKVEQKSTRSGGGTYFQDVMWGYVGAAKGHEAEFTRLVESDERAEVDENGEVNVRYYGGYKDDQPTQTTRLVRAAIDARGTLLFTKKLDEKSEKIITFAEPVDFDINSFTSQGRPS